MKQRLPALAAVLALVAAAAVAGAATSRSTARDPKFVYAFVDVQNGKIGPRTRRTGIKSIRMPKDGLFCIRTSIRFDRDNVLTATVAASKEVELGFAVWVATAPGCKRGETEVDTFKYLGKVPSPAAAETIEQQFSQAALPFVLNGVG